MRTRFLIWTPGIILFVYVVLRAILIPVTHDESNTVLTYAAYSVQDIMLYFDPIPNNHILNTLLIKLFVYLFGLSAFVVRLPNVLGFILFYVFLVRLVQSMRMSGLLSCIAIIFLTCNIFLLDFFSLARGYALACALCMVSVYYAYNYLGKLYEKYVLKSLLFAAIGVYASFTLLNFYVALVIVLLLVSLLRAKSATNNVSFFMAMRKPLVYVFIVSIILGLFILVPVLRMVETDQFVFWGQNNFYTDTLLSLSKGSMYGKAFLGLKTQGWCNVFIVAYILITIVAIRKILHNTYSIANNAFVFFLLLALGTVAVNIAQFYVVGTPYLTSRTALIFIPILSLPFVFLLQSVNHKKVIWQTPFLIAALIYVVVLLDNMNIKMTYEWWFDQDTKYILQLLEQHHNATRSDVTLNTNWIFYPSFNFHKEAANLEWLQLTPFHIPADTNSITEFYYTTFEESDLHKEKYRLYKEFGGYSRQLLIRR